MDNDATKSCMVELNENSSKIIAVIIVNTTFILVSLREQTMVCNSLEPPRFLEQGKFI